MSENVQALQASALLGDAQAQWQLAVCYAQGNGVEQNDAVAFSWVCKAAENGYEEAAKYVLSAYDKGKEELGVRPDLDKLVEWADKLSAAGSNTGRYYYANLYMKDIARDRITPLEAFSRAAKGADEDNLRCMAVACYLGSMVAEAYFANQLIGDAVLTLKSMIRWIEKLDQTEAPIPESLKAGTWYLYGKCLLAQDKDNEAMQWFKKAAPWNANAEIMYGSWLAQEAQQTRNVSLYKEVVSHLMHAVNSSDNKEKFFEANAYYTLAIAARAGLGTNVDMDASYQWMCRAAELGNEKAKQDLPRYHKKLFGGYSYR